MPKKEHAAMGDAVAALVLTPQKPRRKLLSRSSDRAMHKRTRAGATTATLTLRPDGSLVLVVDDVLTKNDRYRLAKARGRATQVESALAKKYKAAVRAALLKFIIEHTVADIFLPIHAGLWRLEVLSVWPTERHHADGTDTANGDSDAPIAMVKDAMQHAGVIDDDMRIVGETTHAVYRKGVRATVAVLRPVGAEEHAAAVVPLLRLLGLSC